MTKGWKNVNCSDLGICEKLVRVKEVLLLAVSTLVSQVGVLANEEVTPDMILEVLVSKFHSPVH